VELLYVALFLRTAISAIRCHHHRQLPSEKETEHICLEIRYDRMQEKKKERNDMKLSIVI